MLLNGEAIPQPNFIMEATTNNLKIHPRVYQEETTGRSGEKVTLRAISDRTLLDNKLVLDIWICVGDDPNPIRVGVLQYVSLQTLLKFSAKAREHFERGELDAQLQSDLDQIRCRLVRSGRKVILRWNQNVYCDNDKCLGIIISCNHKVEYQGSITEQFLKDTNLRIEAVVRESIIAGHITSYNRPNTIMIIGDPVNHTEEVLDESTIYAAYLDHRDGSLHLLDKGLNELLGWPSGWPQQVGNIRDFLSAKKIAYANSPGPSYPELDFIEEAHKLEVAGKLRASLDVVYKQMDFLLKKEMFDYINNVVFDLINLERHSKHIILAILTLTYKPRKLIPNRKHLLAQFEEILVEKGEDVEGILYGLRE